MKTITSPQDLKELDQDEAERLKEYEQFELVKNGASTNELKVSALRSFPYNKLSPNNRTRAKAVLDGVSQYRQLPTVTFASHPCAYEYFIKHPDVAVSLWRALGISKMKMWQTGPMEFECDGGEGTTGILDILYQDQDQTIVFTEGSFHSPLVQIPFKAKGIFHLKSSNEQKVDGTNYVTHMADVYVSFPSMAIENAARLITPVTNVVADRNFREVSLFMHTMALAMETQPGWVEQTSTKMEGVLSKRPHELMEVTVSAHVAALKRMGVGTRSLSSITPASAPVGKFPSEPEALNINVASPAIQESNLRPVNGIKR
jgi:hypothetical protein